MVIAAPDWRYITEIRIDETAGGELLVYDDLTIVLGEVTGGGGTLPPPTPVPVAIDDASFNNRSLNQGGWSNTITPWQESGGNGNGSGFIERIAGFSADGFNHLGMESGHDVWQDLTVTYQPNIRYVLTIAAGHRGGRTNAANQTTYSLASPAGTVFATGTINAPTIPAGTFADATPLVFDVGPASPAAGTPIRILLQARGAGRTHFDNIRLTAVTTLQPPMATTQPATEVTDIDAVLNGIVNTRGADGSVIF